MQPWGLVGRGDWSVLGSSEERAKTLLFNNREEQHSLFLLKIQTTKGPLSREDSILRHLLRNVVSMYITLLRVVLGESGYEGWHRDGARVQLARQDPQRAH